MSIITKIVPAKAPKTKNSVIIAYIYAAILVIFALGQLFSFDDFIRLIESFWLPDGNKLAHPIASVIVIIEVFSLPFLLRMPLSKIMRWMSLVFSLTVPIIWMLISLWVNLTINAVYNIGFLGTIINLTPGFWTVLACANLGILSAWVVWGFWPGKRR